MAKNRTASNGKHRYILAYVTFGVAAGGIAVLAWYSIKVNNENTMTIFNIVLPVFASWVGTILAFYFGRENFESATQQVREMAQQLTPEQRAKSPVSSIMMPRSKMACFTIPKGKSEQDVNLSELLAKLAGSINRLPIIDVDMRPKYMIHESSIDKYIVEGGKKDSTLQAFIEDRKEKAGIDFGLNSGFVVVSEKTTLAEAKHNMDEISFCKDIFITKEGGSKEPLTGWISNVRLAKYLEA